MVLQRRASPQHAVRHDPPQPVARYGKRGEPAIGAITAPLVTLLHRRGELREAVAAADLIDAAIRDGA